MSERKLYLAGFGGNRYETTLEELKKQAFEGKIKRKDKIVVCEVVDEQAKEYVVLCEKVKELQKCFIQGEAQRAMEKRRIEEEKEAAKLAREKEKEEARARKREEQLNAQREQAEKERVEREQILERRKVAEEQRQREKEAETNSDKLTKEALAAVQNSIGSLVGTAIILNIAIWIIGLILVCMAADAAGVNEDDIAGIFVVGLLAIIIFPGALFGSVVGKFLRLPLQISIYQVRAVERMLADAVRDMKSQATAARISDESDSFLNETAKSESFTQQGSTPEFVPVPPRGI